MTSRTDGVIDTVNRSVRFDRQYAFSKVDVWQAFTDPERLARWFASVTGDLRQDGQYRLDFGDGDATTGRIATCHEPHQITATWESPDEGTTWVDLQLFDTGPGTRVVLTHSALRPEDLPQHAAGWHTHLDHLDTVLHGNRPFGWTDRYNELLPRYSSHGPTVPAND